MPSFRRHPAFLASVSLVLLVVYLLGSLGLMPAPRVVAGWVGRVSGDRYPCEECGCGCASATECWTHCCCHTEQQRLMWAITHGVMPPSVVEFSDEQWIGAANAVKKGSAHCSLCVDRIKDELRQGVATVADTPAGCGCDAACGGSCGKVCCSESASSQGCCSRTKAAACATLPPGTDVAPEASSCCSREDQVSSSEAAPAGRSCCAKSKPAPQSTWPVPSASAQTCKGLAQLLSLSLPPAPPVRVVVLFLARPPEYLLAWPEDNAFRSRTLDVSVPPPRVA